MHLLKRNFCSFIKPSAKALQQEMAGGDSTVLMQGSSLMRAAQELSGHPYRFLLQLGLWFWMQLH